MEKTASHVDAAYAQEVNFKFRTGTSNLIKHLQHVDVLDEIHLFIKFQFLVDNLESGSPQ